ncbi:MAG: glutamate racemase [Pseudomonadota bacterium]
MIGVFDSGSGGLTILRAAMAALPEEAFLYFGDHARAPYGQRDNGDIVALTREAVACLFAQGCQLVILACNTAAAVALRSIQQNWLANAAPDHRVLGVLVPTVEAISGLAWHMKARPGKAGPARTVAIFATPKTVEAGAYVEEVAKRAPRTRVIQIAVPDLVGAIEGHAPPALVDALIGEAAASLLARLAGAPLDAVLLGCTHFPLVEEVFRRHLPRGTAIISQPRIVAAALKDYLARHQRLRACDRATGGVRFLTTGDARLAAKVAAALLDWPIVFEAAGLPRHAASSSALAAAPPSIARK